MYLTKQGTLCLSKFDIVFSKFKTKNNTMKNCRFSITLVISLFFFNLNAQKNQVKKPDYWVLKILDKIQYKEEKLYFSKKELKIDSVFTELNYMGMGGIHKVLVIKREFSGSRTKCGAIIRLGFLVFSDKLSHDHWYFQSSYDDPNCKKSGVPGIFLDEQIKFLRQWYEDLKK